MPDVIQVVRSGPVGPTVVQVKRGAAAAVQVVRVAVSAPVVQVSRQGPPGPAGPAGTSGGSGSHMERAFTTASPLWEWDHSLGYTPSVILMTPDRDVVVGHVSYNGPDKTVAEFYLPVAGLMALI